MFYMLISEKLKQEHSELYFEEERKITGMNID